MLPKLKQFGLLLGLCGWPLLLVFVAGPTLMLFVLYCNGWAVIALLTLRDQTGG